MEKGNLRQQIERALEEERNNLFQYASYQQYIRNLRICFSSCFHVRFVAELDVSDSATRF